MKLSELKHDILADELANNLIIFECETSKFFADQYTEEIAVKRNYSIKYYDSLAAIAEAQQSALSVFGVDNVLHVVNTDVFKEECSDLDEYKDCIVICNKIDKKVRPSIDDWYIVTIPQVVDWQVEYYIKTTCPGLSTGAINWLIKHAVNCPTSADSFRTPVINIYKLKNVLDSLKLFDESDREQVLREMINSTSKQLCEMPFFEVTNYIKAKNKDKIAEFFTVQPFCDVDPIPLTNTLLASFKEMLLLVYRSGYTAEALGINPKRVKYIQQDAGRWSAKELRLCIEFLSNLDFKLKSGKLELNNESVTSYIICRLESYMGQYGTV